MHGNFSSIRDNPHYLVEIRDSGEMEKEEESRDRHLSAQQLAVGRLMYDYSNHPE